MRTALSTVATAAAGLLFAAATAPAAVVITEIHYNPNGSEGAAEEWIEIYNNGSTAVNLSGWDWGDRQDGAYSSDFAAGTMLAPNSAAVISVQTESAFRALWGDSSIQVINSAPGASLANSATATNEEVVIRDASDVVVDAVNYEVLTGSYTETTWPESNNRSTIYVLPEFVDQQSNDLGTSWAQSQPGIHLAYEAANFNNLNNISAFDIGSPGKVEAAAVPEPAAASLAALALVGLLGRSRKTYPRL